MANSIPFTPPPKKDSQDFLYQKLQKAPIEHTEALLDGYEILQLLQDKGILEILKGVLGGGEKILEIATKTLETQEFVHFFRNLTILIKIIGGIDPEILEALENSLSESLTKAKTQDPPGLISLLIKFASQGNRRVLSTIASVGESIGQHLSHKKNTQTEEKGRQAVTRRNVSLVRIDPRTP